MDFELINKELDKFSDEGKVKFIDSLKEIGVEDSGLICLQHILSTRYKVLVTPIPIIDLKYRERLMFHIDIKEWSRTHNLWLDKTTTAQYLQYYDNSMEALGYGILQALEIVRLKFYEKDNKDNIQV